MSAVPAYSRYGGHASTSRRHRSANAYGPGNTALDLSRGYESAYAPRRSYEPSRPDIDVIRGRRPQVQTLSPIVPTILKAVAVVLVVLTVFGIARITLNSAALSTAVDVSETSSALASARTEGNKLEVSQSALSNPNHVKEAATALGMGTPAVTTYIDMNTGKSGQVVAPVPVNENEGEGEDSVSEDDGAYEGEGGGAAVFEDDGAYEDDGVEGTGSDGETNEETYADEGEDADVSDLSASGGIE